MWSFTTGYARRMAREVERKRQAQLTMPRFHFRRILAGIKTEEGFGSPTKVLEGRLFLNDFQATSLRFFTTAQLYQGQEISITFEHPTQFFVRGRVNWCRAANRDSHILSATPFPFRAEVVFEFVEKTEQEQVKQYAHNFSRYSCEAVGASK